MQGRARVRKGFFARGPIMTNHKGIFANPHIYSVHYVFVSEICINPRYIMKEFGLVNLEFWSTIMVLFKTLQSRYCR